QIFTDYPVKTINSDPCYLCSSVATIVRGGATSTRLLAVGRQQLFPVNHCMKLLCKRRVVAFQKCVLFKRSWFVPVSEFGERKVVTRFIQIRCEFKSSFESDNSFVVPPGLKKDYA